MKTFLLALLLGLTGFETLAQMPPGFPANNNPQRRVPRYPQAQPGTPAPSPDQNASAPPEEMVPAGTIDFQGVDVDQVLDVYAKLVNRTVIRAALPDAKIVLKTQTPLTKSEAIEALQAVLALNNISLINMGDKFVKASQSDQANGQGGELSDVDATNLPIMGSYITHIVQLKYVKPSLMVPIIQPFAKLQGSIFPIDDNGILVIRDYTENVKRMLEMINRIDVSVPAEYISEVIPIRYAKVDDIANALNSLGGSGGTTVSVGSGVSNSRISGLSGGATGTSISGIGGGSGGIGGAGGVNGGSSGSAFGGSGIARPYGSTTGGVNGTASGGTTSFAQRLNNIINKASGSGGGQDQIQLFGQTKIIPDESSSSLLIFATRQDMAEIKDIISKLDVPLAQVLVEAVIIDVTLGNTFNFGVSAAQNPQSLGGNVIGGGGINNGNSFLNFLQNTMSSTTNTSASGTNILTTIVNTITQNASSVGTNSGSFANSLPGGFSYFGNIGQSWDIALNAAESDNHASIIQRPRIQTSQAIPAQFFVGETVPYVTGNTYGGAYGNSSSYSQLSVGVELDVTPFINPEGAVSMQIQQEIDDLDGFTVISGVGNVPNTIKRTLNTTITVRDRDTVMLGGFIKTDKSHTQSGVPWLSSIPLLGNLFSQRSDSKDREELIVLMRPTVLQTPETAARHTIKEERRLPGVSGAAAEDSADERKLIEAERKKELHNATNGLSADGFFNPPPVEDTNEFELPQHATPSPATNPPDDMPTPTKTPSDPPAASPTPDDTMPPTDDGTTTAPAKPQTVFEQKARQINLASALTPTQNAQLNALLARYMGNEISTEDYQAARKKILAE
jgi:general secretion pathway protein D